MSTGMSNTDGVHPRRPGERTPLRSVENETLHLSTPFSSLKSRFASNCNVPNTQKCEGPVAFCQSEVTGGDAPETSDVAPAVEDASACAPSGLGDVTFKSFACAGGEVVLSDLSVLPERSLVLPLDQIVESLPGGEDSRQTFLSDSMITQCCDDHADHPYCDAGGDITSPEADPSPPCELSSPSVGGVEARGTAACTHHIEESVSAGDVTFKSYVCAGGEVEVSDVVSELSESETVPLSGSQSVSFSHPPNDESTYSSVVADDRDPRLGNDHTDHPYCSTESDAAPVNADLSSFNKTSVNRDISASETGVVPGESAKNQEAGSGPSDVTFKSFTCSGGEVELPDNTPGPSAEWTVPLPGDDQLASSRSQCGATLNPSVVCDDETSGHDEHPYCRDGENGVSAVVESSGASASLKSTERPEPVACQLHFPESSSREGGGRHPVPERAGQESVRAGDGALPSTLRESLVGEVAGGTSAGSSTPVKGEERSSEDPRSQSGAGDAVLLSCGGNEPLPSDSAAGERPDVAAESLLDVLTQLPGFRSVARTLPFELLSPVLRATPVRRKPLRGDSFGGLWSSVALESPALLRPLFNSTALGVASTRKPPVPTAENAAGDEAGGVVEAEDGVPGGGVVEPPSSQLNKADSVAEEEEEEEEEEVFAPAWAPEGEARRRCTAESNAAPLTTPPPRRSSPQLVGERAEEAPGGVASPPPPPPLSQAEPRLPLALSLAPGGALQQQLMQMAQLLIQASAMVEVQPPPPVPAATAAAREVELRSVCVGGAGPAELADRSANTSGVFERKREIATADACTATDSLLWSLAPGSLASLSRQELEQRLTSSMITVEALVQQLASARGQVSRPGGPEGPGPSDLRDRQVQTDHTELSQTTTYRDLYVTALERIRDLELGQSALQNLLDGMLHARSSMAALSADTEAALCSVNQISDLVRDDHQSLLTQYGQMRSLYGRCRSSQTKMVQKVRDALQQREDMRGQMEEAVSHRQAAFSVNEQLRAHCSERISALEECVGSHQELMAALTKTYPQMVTLNKSLVETIDSASELLQGTMSDQATLHQELLSARRLLQRTTPLLRKLNQKAAAALAERDQQRAERDRALEERDKTQEELDLTAASLQEATQQIGDLNLQFTIMMSELGVLRQKLSEEEEDRAGLERKVTELSATVSSSLASYSFLEQALAEETNKLQQSWQVSKQATDRANQLEAALAQSEQRVCELDRALGLSEEQASQLEAQSHSQNLQLQQLHHVHNSVCTELSTMREMSEFLHMENELAREQTMESEGTLRANLQGLRERNIECEDLRRDLNRIRLERQALQAELEVTRAKASGVQTDLRDQLARAAADVALLHQSLRGLTDQLQGALSAKNPASSQEKGGGPQTSVQFERHPASFVDCIMVALEGGRLEDDSPTDTPAGQGASEPQPEGFASETSAFTRIAPGTTPKRSQGAAEEEEEEEEEGGAAPETPAHLGPEEEEGEGEGNVAEMLTDLGTTVSELTSTLTLLCQCWDTEQQAMQDTICVLQGEQEAQAYRHRAEMSELRDQHSRLNTQAERGTAALQSKAQDEKNLKQLYTEVTETKERFLTQKTENTKLHKEVTELRRSLHQSEVEAQVLREELSKAGSQSAAMDDKIRLLKEVERLRKNLQEMMEGKAKLLERAKRHQEVHESNQRKRKSELHLLDNIIETVRKTLRSLPHVLQSCEELRTLAEFIG